jgi:hypothetical protein
VKQLQRQGKGAYLQECLVKLPTVLTKNLYCNFGVKVGSFIQLTIRSLSNGLFLVNNEAFIIKLPILHPLGSSNLPGGGYSSKILRKEVIKTLPLLGREGDSQSKVQKNLPP